MAQHDTYSSADPSLAGTYLFGNTGVGGTPASKNFLPERVLGLAGILPGGRLTLTTATPVTTSDVTSAGTLYYTPWVSDYIRLYDGTRVKEYTFTERSLSLTLTSGKNYDVFLYDNSGTLTLELSAAWTNDTTRADALAWQSGLGYVKSGTATRLHLGVLRASGSNITEDSVLNRYLVNRYNAVPRNLFTCPGYSNGDSASTFTETTATYAAINGGTGATVNYLTLGDRPAEFFLSAAVQNDTSAKQTRLGIGDDSTTSASVAANHQVATTGTYQALAAGKVLWHAAGKYSASLIVMVNGGTSTILADLARNGSTADPPVTYLRGVIWG